MSDIDIVIPDYNNSIDITLPDEEPEKEIETKDNPNKTDISGGSDKVYSDLAKDWAIKMDGKVLGEDYSAKYYANKAIVDVDAAIKKIFEDINTEGNISFSYENGVLTISNYTYEFEQAVSSDTWTINHNLGKYPTVIVVDSSGNVFEPAVQYTNKNTCVIEMLGGTTGKAYLN